MKRWPHFKDSVLFAAGLAIVALMCWRYFVADKSVDPSLIVLAAGLLGLPAFFSRNGG